MTISAGLGAPIRASPVEAADRPDEDDVDDDSEELSDASGVW